MPIPQLDLSSSGETTNLHLGGSYLFHRDQTTKSTFHFGIDYAVVENFLGDVKLDTSSRQVALGKIGVSHSRPFKKGKIDSTLDYTQSLPIFNSFGPEDQLGPDSPDGNFGIITWDNHFSRACALPLGEAKIPFYWSTNLNLQYSPDILFSSQQLGLGGRGSVRGYRDESILTRSGLYWRNDLTIPVTLPANLAQNPPGHLQLYGAYDLGTGYGPDREEEQQGLIHGTAGGFRFGRGKLNGEFSVAFPLGAPEAIRGTTEIYFGSLSVTF